LGPFELPTTFASLWIDSSVQILRATSAFWGATLSPTVGGGAAPAPNRSLTSTAAPWWKAPETPIAMDAAAWANLWLPAATPQRSSPATTNPFMAAWAPWLPAQAALAPAPSGPMEFWQRAWLQNMPQLAPFGAAFAGPAAFTAMPAVPAPWQPVATAYRSANGHAMAAVLRTMADVVEPKRGTTDLTNFWFNPLGTRH
jgi:hypothetical protein